MAVLYIYYFKNNKNALTQLKCVFLETYTHREQKMFISYRSFVFANFTIRNLEK